MSRELDRIAAIELDGWKDQSGITCDPEGFGRPWPHYSTNIVDAWQLVEAFNLLSFSLMYDYDKNAWRCNITAYTHEPSQQGGTYTKHWHGLGVAKTKEIAIVLACLTAKNIDVSKWEKK